MLKKFKCIPALFLVIILFAGCAQKETPYISNEYVLEYENDKCYMSFMGERKVEEKDLSECETFGLTFTSLDELKDTIIIHSLACIINGANPKAIHGKTIL